MSQDPSNPVPYFFEKLVDESRILQSFGTPRSPIPITIVPKGIVPPPPAVARYRHSTIIPVADPRIFIVAEWTEGDRASNEPVLHRVDRD